MCQRRKWIKGLENIIYFVFGKNYFSGNGNSVITYSVFYFSNVIAWFASDRSMKSKISATYPDAFPDYSANEVVDERPDLEMPK